MIMDTFRWLKQKNCEARELRRRREQQKKAFYVESRLLAQSMKRSQIYTYIYPKIRMLIIDVQLVLLTDLPDSKDIIHRLLLLLLISG